MGSAATLRFDIPDGVVLVSVLCSAPMSAAWFFPRFAWFAAPRERFSPPKGSARTPQLASPGLTNVASLTSSTSVLLGGIASAELVSRLREGDRDALGITYTALYDTLVRLAVLRTRSLDTAVEVVHDVFLALWSRRESLTADTDLRVYLAASVRNRTRNLWEHDAIVSTVEHAVTDDALPAPAIGQPEALPDAAAEASEFRAAYREALGILTERERAAALLRWEDGFTFEQVGHVLGVSTVGARAIVLRAQRKVQAGLAKYRG